MQKNTHRFLILICLWGLSSVIAGAYFSHGLTLDDTQSKIIDTALMYHLVYAVFSFVLVYCAVSIKAGLLFFTGSLIFSGSIYAKILLSLSLSITPLGGILFMGGWLILIYELISRK